MRVQNILLAVVLLAVVFVPGIADGSDAEEPAVVYFYDGDTCIKEVHLTPGTPIGDELPEVPEWAVYWVDGDNYKVTADSTFPSGDHDVTASSKVPRRTEEPNYLGAGLAVGGTLIAAVIMLGLAYLYYRRH